MESSEFVSNERIFCPFYLPVALKPLLSLVVMVEKHTWHRILEIIHCWLSCTSPGNLGMHRSFSQQMKSIKLKPLPASSGPSPICSCCSCWDEPLLPKMIHIDIWPGLQSSINPIDNPTSANVSYAHFAFCATQVAPVITPVI